MRQYHLQRCSSLGPRPPKEMHTHTIQTCLQPQPAVPEPTSQQDLEDAQAENSKLQSDVADLQGKLAQVVPTLPLVIVLLVFPSIWLAWPTCPMHAPNPERGICT